MLSEPFREGVRVVPGGKFGRYTGAKTGRTVPRGEFFEHIWDFSDSFVVYFSEVEIGCGRSDHRPFTLSLPRGT